MSGFGAFNTQKVPVHATERTLEPNIQRMYTQAPRNPAEPAAQPSTRHEMPNPNPFRPRSRWLAIATATQGSNELAKPGTADHKSGGMTFCKRSAIYVAGNAELFKESHNMMGVDWPANSIQSPEAAGLATR